jgi:hypothetical protein
MKTSHSKLILWFTSDKATLVVVVPSIVALLAQLEHPQLVVSRKVKEKVRQTDNVVSNRL